MTKVTGLRNYTDTRTGATVRKDVETEVDPKHMDALAAVGAIDRPAQAPKKKTAANTSE